MWTSLDFMNLTFASDIDISIPATSLDEYALRGAKRRGSKNIRCRTGSENITSSMSAMHFTSSAAVEAVAGRRARNNSLRPGPGRGFAVLLQIMPGPLTIENRMRPGYLQE